MTTGASGSARLVVLARGPWWLPMRSEPMTRAMLEAGYQVVGIVVERRSTWSSLSDWTRKLGVSLVLQKARASLRAKLSRKTARRGPSNTGHAARLPKPRVFRVGNHNSEKAIKLVQRLAPDLMLLRGARILRPPLLAVPALGTLNAHYGKLPEYRGVDATEWAVFHGEPPMVSVHWVLAGVDTGAVLLADRIPFEQGDSLGQLRERSAVLARRLLAAAMSEIVSKGLRPKEAAVTMSRQFYKMHPRLRRLAQLQLTWRDVATS